MPDALDLRLLNDFQRDFPLEERPFAAIAAQVAVSEDEVIWRYRRLVQTGFLSRIGVVFRPNAAGASTLAAMAVPAGRLEPVAAFVTAQPEVNHNYEREHRFNLWFVLTAPAEAQLQAAIARIEGKCGLPLLSLPLEEEYHIDLGFDLHTGTVPREKRRGLQRSDATIDEDERPLVAALQEGFPLLPRPFASIGGAAGMDAASVRQTLARWLGCGVARRIGAVVRHRRLGYEANAMAVWDVADASVERAGAHLAAAPEVTLCYRRPRRPPWWRYNLFCMIHGRDRERVRERIAVLGEAAGLGGAAHEVLFSRRCFKQRGARYAVPGEVAHG